jgi:MGT family glycosyltransferase
MRMLFTTTAGSGHFHPLVPLARAAQARGHTVAFACPRLFCPQVEASGFQALVGREETDGPDLEWQTIFEQVLALPERAGNAFYFLNRFVDLNTKRSMPTLVDVCHGWRPDIIVRESFEFAGAIAAEHLGLPHATVQVGFQPHIFDVPQQELSTRLDRIRHQWGLPPDPHLETLYRNLLLSFVPPSFQDPRTLAIGTLHSLGTVIFDRSGAEALPVWAKQPRVPPVIYLTLGTEMTKLPGIYPDAFQILIAGLRDTAGTLIVSVGRNMDPAALEPQPAHVHIERYIPQSLLLPHCDLVVSHGGHNTVLAALHEGLPLVLIPITADQPNTAGHCAALGVGQVVALADLAVDVVRNTARELLINSIYRRNAERIRTEMQSLPGAEYGVALLEQLRVEKALDVTAR